MHGHHAQPVGGRPSRARSTCDRPPSRQTSGTQSQRCRGSFLTVMGACVWCVWCGRGQSIYPIYWPIVSGYLTNSQHQLLVGLKTIFIHLLSSCLIGRHRCAQSAERGPRERTCAVINQNVYSLGIPILIFPHTSFDS